jgi:hypothetical protein
VRKQFKLELTVADLFKRVKPLEPSAGLRHALDAGFLLAMVSEKARSEFIVAPILLFIREIHLDKISIYSGVKFDVEPDKGLRGTCDFILSKSVMMPTIQAPAFVLVEAKKHDIEEGLGQCAAEMVAAQLFNDREGNRVPSIYGCVTNGESWQFMRLTGSQLEIDKQRYFLGKLSETIGILSRIVREMLA